MQYYLPSKIASYLRRLDLEYARVPEVVLREIVRSAHVYVVEATSYDNLDGGTHGHDVILFLPAAIVGRISLRTQAKLSDRIQADLNECAKGIANEFVNSVALDLNDESDLRYQQAVPFDGKPRVNPDALSIWKPGFIRLFISHRDSYKKQARQLGDAMETFGVSSFVAHDTIEPMEAWQVEIEKGLQTMEVMLAFLTDDFHDSTWTNQEVGYALGQGTPIIPVKMGTHDPQGFLAARQALRGSLENPEGSAKGLYDVLAAKLGQKDRLQQTLIASFLDTPDWGEATLRFKLLEKYIVKLSEDELSQIIVGFEKNDQLYNASYLVNGADRFKKFLERATGKQFSVSRGKVRQVKLIDGNIPF